MDRLWPMIMTKKEVAAALRISKKTLERLEAANRMPPRVQLAARRIGYRSEHIEELMTLSKIDWKLADPQSRQSSSNSSPGLPK